MKILLAVALAACGNIAALASSAAYSDPGNIAPADTFTATTSGDEIAYFYGSTAQYVDLIGLWAGGVQLGTYALDNHTSSFGQSVDFGHVDAGETLVFSLEVLSKGYSVYSDAAMNSDGANHVYTSPFSGVTRKKGSIPAGTFVAFEDLLLPHSNLNYDDEDVVFSNVTATPVVAEPGPLLLSGVGLAALALTIARKRRAANG